MLSITPGDPGVVQEVLRVTPALIARPESPYTRPIAPELEGQIAPELWEAVGKIEKDLMKGAFTIVPGSTKLAAIDLANIAPARVNESGAIHVYAEMNSFQPDALRSIEALGLDIIRANEAYGAAEIWVSYELVDDLAALPAVSLVRLPVYPVLRTGSVNSAGDGILNSDDVRSRFTAAIGNLVDGSGVRIGVISDGVEIRSQVQGGATPDLPAITIDPIQGGSGDEEQPC